jgi:hypothetical protein
MHNLDNTCYLTSMASMLYYPCTFEQTDLCVHQNTSILANKTAFFIMDVHLNRINIYIDM